MGIDHSYILLNSDIVALFPRDLLCLDHAYLLGKSRYSIFPPLHSQAVKAMQSQAARVDHGHGPSCEWAHTELGTLDKKRGIYNQVGCV